MCTLTLLLLLTYHESSRYTMFTILVCPIIRDYSENGYIRILNRAVFGHFRPNTKSRDTPVVYNTIIAFLLSYFIIIQKIIKNGQAVLEIFNFEKSSDLIGRAVFGHFRPNTNFPEISDSATFYPLYPSNFMQKIRKK